MAHRVPAVLLVSIALTTPALATAQNDASKPLTFEVVSVKPAVDTDVRRLEWTPGHFIARSVPFIGLVNMAYGNGEPVRLDGAQALRATMWDLEATFDAALAPTPEQRAQMLRAVLEDRFQLVLRREARETDVYALVLARADGRLGASFRRSELPCDAPSRARMSVLPNQDQRPSCGVVTSLPASAILGGNTTLEPFTRPLRSILGRPVIDRTGLTGAFDIVLVFAMDWVRMPPGITPLAEPSGLPSLVTALREQLGLKLEPTRTPLDYYVIEHVESPSPN